MESAGTEPPVSEGSREPTLHEHPVDAELSSSDFQVTPASVRHVDTSIFVTVTRHGIRVHATRVRTTS